jgi:hypothetical protein
VALMRVYCGVTTAEMAPWLTVAIVDDAGRLLDMRHISDDPAGYAYLGALLADRSGGVAPVALDRGEHLVAQLLAAANTPIALCDETSLADFADRFSDDTSYEEMQAPLSQRSAVGLARALQAGALYATAQSPSWNLEEFKPVLAAHAAVTAGRNAAAAALREVLRELYPAALRAYPDPAEHVPLRILEELPEPSLLSPSPSNRGRDAALIAELAGSGAADETTAVNAITALRVAVEESPRWHTNRALAPVVAETVRQAVAAVRACDAASAVLVGTLVERLGALSAVPPQAPYIAAAAPVSPAIPRRVPGPAAEVPWGRVSARASAASAAASGVPAASFATAERSQAGNFAALAERNQASFAGAERNRAGSAIPGPRPEPAVSGSGRPSPGGAEWAMRPPLDDDFAAVYASLPASAHPSGEFRRVEAEGFTDVNTLSFSMDPLNAPLNLPPPEPPSLRLVEPPPPAPAPPSVDNGKGNGHSHGFVDPLTDPLPGRHSAPALRVIDGGRQAPPPRPTAPEDNDLLIFSQTQSNSAWFLMNDDTLASPEPPRWGDHVADEGWRAAEQLSRPSVGADTRAGLPRRVPTANLVPGSVHPQSRQLRIVRDPESIAEHTSGYFRGWKRGQEIGGFPVGQRDRAAWEFNREQRAREGADPRARLS